MLEKWEKESTLMLMDKTATPLPDATQIKELGNPTASKTTGGGKSSYDNLFN